MKSEKWDYYMTDNSESFIVKEVNYSGKLSYDSLQTFAIIGWAIIISVCALFLAKWIITRNEERSSMSHKIMQLDLRVERLETKENK
jgi:hypothetical protein